MFIFLLFLTSVILLLQKKAKEAFFIQILISTQINRMYFVSDPTVAGFRFQNWDVIIAFMLISYINTLFLRKKGCKAKHEALQIEKWLYTFLGFIAISAFIDAFRNGTAISDIIKTVRPWLMVFIMPLMRYYLNRKEIIWILSSLVIFTGICLIIVPLQGVLPFELPGAARGDGMGETRYGIMPYFWFLYIWFVAFATKLPVKYKVVLIILLFVSLIFTQARKNLIAILIPWIFFNLRSFNLKKIPLVITSLVLIIVWYFNFAPPRVRLLHEEFGALFKNNLSSYYMGTPNTTEERLLYGENNIQYRAFHLIERLQYLKRDPIWFLFGYSLIHESNFKKKIFYICESGHKQLDTGDISWSYLLVRYGALGMLLTCCYIYLFMKEFITIRGSHYAKIGIGYMLSVLTLSIGDAFLIFPNVYFVPYLLLLISRKTDIVPLKTAVR